MPRQNITDLRMSESMDDFADFLRIQGIRHGVSDSTVNAYTAAVRRFIGVVGDIPAHELTGSHVIRYKAHLLKPVCGDNPPVYAGTSPRDRQKYIILNWPSHSPGSVAKSLGIDGPALSRIVSALRDAGFDLEKKAGRQRKERASSAFIAAEIAALAAYAAFLGSTYKLQNIAASDIQPLRPRVSSSIPQAGDRIMIDELLDAADSRTDKLIIALLYFCGLRRMEVANLRLSDVRIRRGQDQDAESGPESAPESGMEYQLLIKGKGDKQRLIPVARAMVSLLIERLAELDGRAGENPLIVDAGYNEIWKRVKAVARRAEIAENIHPHMLRHTAATVMLEQGENIRTIQTFLGHESIQTTARYAQVRDGWVKNAVGKL